MSVDVVPMGARRYVLKCGCNLIVCFADAPPRCSACNVVGVRSQKTTHVLPLRGPRRLLPRGYA